jgi:hypothetical protein
MTDLSKFKRGITIRVTQEQWDDLKKIAKENDRPITSEVVSIIHDYLQSKRLAENEPQ